MKKHHTWWKWLVGFAVFVGLVVLWGVGIEPRLIDVEAEQATLPLLPSAWDGARVAVVGDFQVGMFLDNSDTVERVIQRLVKARPAAVLIAGDFILGADPEQETKEIARLLKPLGDSGIPTFAVLGNHDYAMRHREEPIQPEVAEGVARAVEDSGIRVLRNEAVPVRGPGGTPLYVVGIDAQWPDRARPQEAISQVPPGAPRVVFMHNPHSYPGLPAGSAPLAVAGHTHGGQLRIPFTPEWSWLTFVKDEEVHADGWIHDYGKPGNHLYVNRGIGFSEVPVRINCPPEVTYFTLHTPAGAEPRARQRPER